MIRAIRYENRTAFRASSPPGAILFDLTGDTMAMWFQCPCGCGDFARIPVGRNVKPAQSPSWKWTGPLNDPTLEPSVHQLNCGWHGWLRAGYWESV